MLGEPFTEARQRGRKRVNDWDDDALDELERKVGKIGKDEEDASEVLKMDRVLKNSTDVISTEASGAASGFVSFQEGTSCNVKGGDPEGAT